MPKSAWSDGLSPKAAGRALLTRACMGTYPTAKAYGRAVVHRRLRRVPPPIIVYQMGKVGSETVVRSLRAHPDTRVRGALHVHFLDPARLQDEEAAYRATWRGFTQAWHVWAGQALRRHMQVHPDTRWDVVTLVRDPVARNLSSFFQVGAVRHGLTFRHGPNHELLDDRAVSDLATAFSEQFQGHEEPQRWFDDELAAHLGVDVYATPFAKEQGWQMYESEHARVLLIRLENLRQVADPAFDRFLGLGSFPLHERNAGAHKYYGPTYTRFLQRVRLPASYLDAMYESRYVNHFYGTEQAAVFRRKWEQVGGLSMDRGELPAP